MGSPSQRNVGDETPFEIARGSLSTTLRKRGRILASFVAPAEILVRIV